MTAAELIEIALCGETTTVQFKQEFTSQKDIANGRNKPYKTLTGEIWVKQGADKRRVTENSEILALFQESGAYQPDAASVDNTSFDDLDRKALDNYLRQVYSKTIDGFGANSEQVLRNIHIMNQDGKPTLAGYLFFGKNPEYNCPTCMVKAVAFYGNELSGTRFRDTKEILGNMPEIYEKCMSFLKANLHNLQEEGASFNTLGKLEIAEDILEEVVQNALIHRDLLRSAPIRIFIFDNRVEVISPGALAGGLTIEDICNGKTFQRNPFMAVFATNALRYSGIGSGILRILKENNDISFENDDSGKEFKVIIRRDYSDVSEPSEVIAEQNDDCTKNEGDVTKNVTKDITDKLTERQRLIVKRLIETGVMDVTKNVTKNVTENVTSLAVYLNVTKRTIKRDLAALQSLGAIKHEGPANGGKWMVLVNV